MPLTVLYFAAAREKAGCAREVLPWEGGGTVAALLEVLVARHPGLASLRPYLQIAVDQAMASADAAVPDGAEVALVPPVSGGSGPPGWITDLPLRLDEVVDAVSAPGRGGVVTFSGAVRAETAGKAVVALEYEAYAPMAEKVYAAIAAEVAARWPGAALAARHRVGTVRPGELAVVVAAGAPHRAAAFEACRYAIDAIKSRAPIWKRERYADGAAWVGLAPES